MMNLRFVFRWLWVCCGLVVVSPQSLRAEVSQSPPAPYAESVRPLLKPLAEIVKTKDPHAGKDEAGTVRLTEIVTRVNEDGTYLRAVHSIIQPYTQKGAETSATRRFRFQSHQETVHLALARTVMPDGTEKPLAPNAAFIQKSEQGADSIYDDGQDLVLVFPDVKPGVLCEAVVVYERKIPAVTGGYSEFVDWAAGWPIGVKRRVVDLPAAWEKRLKVETIGKRGASLVELPASEGRLRRSWQRENLVPAADEPNPAPEMQAGPGTWLTTFGNWDEVAAWYSGLLAERGDLGDELRAKVDEWTKDAKSPRETLGILYDHVANDVRYEGLEFGLSGLQPYPCATVWKNQYGDCKDKANLLVAMLRHKGIVGKVVLISTEHAGLVPKNAPDYQHFNHAIALVDLPDGKGGVERVFCDGTIAHGKPGMLAPSSDDREALAVSGDKAEWVKTPAVMAGTDDYGFDLEMNPDGGLSGWMTLKSTGFYGIQLANSFAGGDRDSAESRLRSYVTGFFPGAEVVDFVLPPEKREIEETVVKVFFTSPARQPDSEGRVSLPFPRARGLFPDFGDGKDRQTAFHMWRDEIRVVAKIRLPQGWSPESLPTPLTLETAPYQLSGQWKHAGGVCEALLSVKSLQSYLPADQVASPAQANRAMLSWLEVPLRLKKGAAESPAANAEVAMPLMPTGKGQVNLVNRWYPKGSDLTKRRAALEQVLRFFPEDTQAAYLVKLELGFDLYSSKKYQDANDVFAVVSKTRPEGIDAEYQAFARYFEALSLRELKREDEALPIFRALAADGAISDYRRGWAATMAGMILQKKPPVTAEAVALLKQGAELDEDARELAVVTLIPAMVSAGQGEALVKELGDGSLLHGAEDGGKVVFESLVATYRSGDTLGQPLAGLLPWLQKAREVAGDSERGKVIAKAHDDLLGWSTRGDTHANVRTELVAALERERPEALKDLVITRFSTAAAAEKHLKSIHDTDAAAWMNLAACYFKKFEPTDEFPTIFWQYVSQVQVNEKAWVQPDGKTFFTVLAAIAEKLPRDGDAYWEIQFTKAQWLQDRGKLDESVALFESMQAAADFPTDYRHAAFSRLGRAYESQGRFRQAADAYLKLKEERREVMLVAEDLLRAGLCLARIGEEDEALRTWALLKDVPESVQEKSVLQGEISEAVLLASRPEETLAQWKRTKDWWKDSFTPYFQSLRAGVMGRPEFFLSDGVDALNQRCRKAAVTKDLAALAKEWATIAMTSRWLPIHSRNLRMLYQNFLLPLSPRVEAEGKRCMAAGAATTTVARIDVLEECIRYHAAIMYDTGKPELALQILEGQMDAAPGRSVDHLERCAWLFAAAAGKTGQRMEEALKFAEPWIKGEARALSIGQWSATYGELLARAGRQPEAIAYLEQQATKAKGNAADEAAIAERLADLKERDTPGGGDFATVVERFLKQNRPAWYDYVGPATLEDPRVGDPAKVLEGDLSRFQPAEKWRLFQLLAASPDVPIEVRQQAYLKGVLAAGERETTWSQAVSIWTQALEEKAVPIELRLPLFWDGARLLAENGQTKALARMRRLPVFARYSAPYREQHFPTLEKIAEAVEKGPEGFRKLIAANTNRTLNRLDLSLADSAYTGLLAAGDFEGATTAREALKNWKLEPDALALRQSMRVDWLRKANQAKPFSGLHQQLSALYGEPLAKLAKKAPAIWRERVDLQRMWDLPIKEREAIFAAMVDSGFRVDRRRADLWLRSPDFWLKHGGTVDRGRLVKAFEGVNGLTDEWSCIFVGSLLERVRLTATEPWDDLRVAVRGYLDRNKSPYAESFFWLWTANPFREGVRIDIGRLMETVKAGGPPREAMLAPAFEIYLLNGDRGGLESALAVARPEELTKPYTLPTYLHVLKFLKREEELELAIEDAERVIRLGFLRAWVDHSGSAFQESCDLALQCNRRDLIPAALLAEVATVFPPDNDRHLALARVAELKGDGKAMKAALDQIQTPAMEQEADCRWLRGIALELMGDTQAARAEMEALSKVPQRGNDRLLDVTEWLAKPAPAAK